MKTDRYTKIVLTAIAVLLAVIAFRPLFEPARVGADSTAEFDYLRFDPDVTKISAPDGSADLIGRVAIDMRNGDIYGFPTDHLGYPRQPVEGKPGTSDPMYLGRFRLDRIRALPHGGR